MDGYSSIDQEFTEKLIEIIHANLGNENFGVNELVQKTGVSHYTLSHRLGSVTGNTINQFIRETRLHKALEMLQKKDMTVTEVAYQTGFGSATYFNTCFSEFFGYPPGTVKKGEFKNIHEVKAFPNLEKERQKRTIFIVSTGLIISALVFIIIYHISSGESSDNSSGNLGIQERSIAVLPFRNLSDSTSNQYFAFGITEDILTLLSNVQDMRVVPITSVEPFNESKFSASEIAAKLKVNYLVEGSVQKSGKMFRIRIRLIDAKAGQQMWSEVYDGNYSIDLFDFQSSIAKKVAASLNAVILPREGKRIDTKPTSDLLAHSLAMKGGEMYNQWWKTFDSSYLRIALNYYNESLKIDPDYLDALQAKGNIFISVGKYDSAMIIFDEILKIDQENPGALTGKGRLYINNNKVDSAIKYLQKSVDVSPNNAWTNLYLGQALIFGQNDVIKGLPFFQKAYDLAKNTGSEIIMDVGWAYFWIGEYPKALKYIKETLSKEPSWCLMVIQYYNILYIQGNYTGALNFLDSIQNYTPCESACDMMRFYYHTSQRDFKKAELYHNKALDAGFANNFKFFYNVYFNYFLKETGRKNEAIKGLKNSIKYFEEDILKVHGVNLARERLQLAACYAMLGENEKALDCLSQLEKYGLFEYPITLAFPGFDNLRNDPEFKAIVKHIEDQRATVREKVREMEQSGELHL